MRYEAVLSRMEDRWLIVDTQHPLGSAFLPRKQIVYVIGNDELSHRTAQSVADALNAQPIPDSVYEPYYRAPGIVVSLGDDE